MNTAKCTMLSMATMVLDDERIDHQAQFNGFVGDRVHFYKVNKLTSVY
jgi:hypothetical protein